MNHVDRFHMLKVVVFDVQTVMIFIIYVIRIKKKKKSVACDPKVTALWFKKQQQFTLRIMTF